MTAPQFRLERQQESMVVRLLQQGDSVSIERGRLVIRPASGKPVPNTWLAEHRDTIVTEIMQAIGSEAFRYAGFSANRYGERRFSGLTLQFRSVATGEDAHTFFNVDLARKRNTVGGKAGTPLPGKEFRVCKRSAFFKFWVSTGLAIPARMQRFNKCMGKLAAILVVGMLTKDRLDRRLDAQTIKPLDVTADRVRMAVLEHKSGTEWTQEGHNEGTVPGHNKIPQDQAVRGMQPFPTTCDQNHENKLTSKRIYTEDSFSPSSANTQEAPPVPQHQTDAEWLAEYDRAPQPHL